MLLPYQQRWVEDKSNVKVIEKSRRIGISYATAFEACIEAMMGNDCWYIGYDEKMCREFIADCARWALYLEKLSPGKKITDLVIMDQVRFSNGSKISALSSNPRTLRGKRGFAVIDEAAFHDDFPGLQKSAIAITMWGGRVAIISTHFGIDNAFNRLVQAIKSGDKPFSLHTVTIDDALNDGLYDRICWAKGEKPKEDGVIKWRKELFDEYGDFAAEELLCVPDNSSGVYFSHSLLTDAAVPAPVFRFEFTEASTPTDAAELKYKAQGLVSQLKYATKNTGGQVCIGVDFGRLNDITSIAVMCVTRHGVCLPALYVEMKNASFKLQEEFLIALATDMGNVVGIGIDSNGSGAYLGNAMVQAFGPIADAVNTNNRFYSEAFGGLKAAIQQKIFFIPGDKEVITDMLFVRLIDGIPKIPKKSTMSAIAVEGRTSKRHGDSAVALALAWQQVSKKTYLGSAIMLAEPHKTHRLEQKNDWGKDGSARHKEKRWF